MKKLLLFALMLSVAGCVPAVVPVTDDESGETTDPTTPTTPQEEVSEPTGKRVALSSSVNAVQPMTGLVMWADSDYNSKSYIQLEFAYMLYSDVCKTKDTYDWSPVEKLLDAISKRGHQAVLRFRYVYPGDKKSCAVPDYIKKWDGYQKTTYNTEDGYAEYPDWRCTELQRFHKEFHRLFAQKYDKDPRLAFLETGFGHWAEYHVYGGRYISGQTFPSPEFQKEFLPLMDQWFKETPWMISIDAADASYGSPFPSTPSLLNLNFGNFDDSFMHENWDAYNYSCWKFFGEQRYKKAPLGGEFSYYSDYDQKHCLDAAGMYGRTFESQAARTHMTFIIGADQPSYQSSSRLKEASMAMGYRFEIKDYLVDEGKSASVLIANVGVAPIYRSAFVSVEGVKGSYDLKDLMPGEEKWVNIACKATSKSVPAIACDHLVSGQKIQYQANVKAQ